MTARLALLWEKVSSSYWFVPGLLLAVCGALAPLVVALDGTIETDTLRGMWWVFSGGPEGARSVLSTVAGSIITVAGVTFSITITVLSLTSSQFGPRLLRGFLRDTANQAVLGTFLGTFLYCLLVLRTVRSVEEVAFVPHVAVTLGLVFAIASVCMLVFFIHHVTLSIQADHLIAGVARELQEAMDRLFPDEVGYGEGEEEGGEDGGAAAIPPPDWESRAARARPVLATHSGYVQAVDGDALMRLAGERDLLLKVLHPPGRFVRRGAPLVLVGPPPGSEHRADAATIPDDLAADDLAARVNDAFTLGDHRTLTQDVHFGVQQLVEVAARALSPGINDPFTAVRCLDRLGEALCQMCGRTLPSPLRRDEQGTLRVIAPPVRFADLADLAFDEIRGYGAGDRAVMTRLFEVLADLAGCARTGEQSDTVRRHAALAWEACSTALAVSGDRDHIEGHYRAVLHAIA